MSTKNREENRTARAQAIQREQKAAERNRRIFITLAIVLVLSAVVAAVVIFSDKPGTTTKPDAAGALPPAAASGQSLVVGSNDSAKYKVVVYEDFLCPYCREFETSTRDFLHAAAKKGTVQVQYRPFHLLQDDYSTRALSAWAAVLQKGTPAQALKFHDLLYDRQPYESSTSKPDADQLASWAKESGVTSSSVLDAVKTLDPAFVNAADATADQAKVTGTPTVTVNGQELQGNSVADMSDNLEKMLAGG